MNMIVVSHTLEKFISAKKLSFFGFRQKRNFLLCPVRRSKDKTIQQIRDHVMKLLGQDKVYSLDMKSREHLLKYMPKSQDELPVRKMKDSWDSAIVPLSTNVTLRDKYTSTLGHVRLGRLLEDMDLFAGHISYKHVDYPNIPEEFPFPIVIVTVSVSQIDFLKQVKPSFDIRLSGHVSWVGKSSMEIVVLMHQKTSEKWEQITRALFVMAARNSTNTGPAFLNPIRAETKEEEDMFRGGQERSSKRQKLITDSVLTKVPSEEEFTLVHSLFVHTIDPKGLFLDKRILPPNSKWMKDATLSTLVFCHPEHRNLHNKIFGGYLMRKALELSWIIGFLHSKKVPKLIRSSNITFYIPVGVGSIVKMLGSVTYTEGNYIQVFVSAETYTSLSLVGTSATSFNFTYDLGKPVDQVFPATYLEAMKFLDGRRHFKNIIDLGEGGNQSES